MKKIKLTRGMYAKVDDADFEKMNKRNWYLNATKKKNGNQATLKIYSDFDGIKVEFGEYLTGMNKETHFLSFKNHDRLDFRRENIKEIPIEYLLYHKLAKANNSSKYKGVFYSKTLKKYEARIKYEGELIIIGRSEDEDEAGRMYNEKTRELFGEYAFQNVIGEDNRKKDVDLEGMKEPRSRKTMKKDYSQKYRGVTKTDKGKYETTIQTRYLGVYETEEDAAYAYNQEALKVYGERAILNELPKGFVGKGRIGREKIMLFGEEYNTIHQIAIKYGIPPKTLKKRVEIMPLEEAVKIPKGTKMKNTKEEN